LTIWQIDPEVASGMLPAVTVACSTVVMIPLSGAPATPGVTSTAHPMLTGGPGIVGTSS
jgi:hypothetical protein